MRVYKGSGCKFCAFLTSTLDGGEGSGSRSGHLTPKRSSSVIPLISCLLKVVLGVIMKGTTEHCSSSQQWVS